jgi:hypothetical protein
VPKEYNRTPKEEVPRRGPDNGKINKKIDNRQQPAIVPETTKQPSEKQKHRSVAFKIHNIKETLLS